MSKRIIKYIIGLLITTSFSLSIGLQASAIDANSIKSKAAFEGVWQCYQNGAFRASWEASKLKNEFVLNTISEETVKLPYGLTDAGDNNANCKQIMFGFMDNSSKSDSLNEGLIPEGIQDSTSSSQIADFFAGPEHDGQGGLGYTASLSGDVTAGQVAQQLTYSIQDVSSCVDGAGRQIAQTLVRYGGDDDSDLGGLIFPRITKDNSGNWFFGNTAQDVAGINVPAPGSGAVYYYTVCGTIIGVKDNGDAKNINYEFYGSTDSEGQTIQASGGGYIVANPIEYYNSSDRTLNSLKLVPSITEEEIEGGDESAFDNYRLNWGGYGIKLLQGLNSKNGIGYGVGQLTKYDDLALSEQEVYDLYKYYLKDVFNVPIICDGEENYNLYDDTNSKLINWKKDTECRAYTSYSGIIEPPEAVYGVDDNFHFTATVDIDDIINTLNAIDLESIEDSSEGGTIDYSDPNNINGSTEDPNKVCKRNSGALGWIICPVIAGISGIGQDLYAQVEENFLQIQSDSFFGSGSGLETAWGYFRDFANVAFIILFLFVIFSQLTGVGIDNYGIKKIMPKLIVTAILVNLSFIVCELAADVSNILGAGLKDLFSNLGNEITVEGTPVGVGQSIAAVGIAGGGALLWGLFSTGFAGLATAAVAVGLAVLGVVISLVISMFFLYLILMIRNAGIVLLIAISPIAFVCYMLPNTEKFFKKWLDLFKALILVYPICGLMVGGGILAGHVLASIGTTPMVLAGMIVEVLPYFLIPMLLRQSLALMGNVGAKLSNFGRGVSNRMSGGVEKGVTNSNRYKEAMQFRQNERSFRRARRVVSRLNRRSGGDPSNLSARNQDRLTNATKTLNEQTERREQARAGIAVVNAGVVYQEKQNERTRQEAKNQVGVATLNPDTVRQQLQNERLKTEVEMDVGVAPVNIDNLRRRAQNSVNEALADNDVEVLEVNRNLATQRRQSARDAQERKNFQDQFAGMSRQQILEEAGWDGHNFNGVGWIGEQNASQRMSALLEAMESRGMEKEMSNVLANNNVSQFDGVMQTLAGSKNAVFQAYGKRGRKPRLDNNGNQMVDVNGNPVYNDMSFNDFMTGDANATNGQSMAAYFREKGRDSLSKLDDKSLGIVSRYQQQVQQAAAATGGTAHNIMSTDLLVDAAAQLNGEDSMKEVNGMLQNRNDIRMTGEQLANLNNSTATVLTGNARARAAMVSASEDAKNNPELMNKMKAGVRQSVNNVRTARGMNRI